MCTTKHSACHGRALTFDLDQIRLIFELMSLMQHNKTNKKPCQLHVPVRGENTLREEFKKGGGICGLVIPRYV